MECGTDYFLVNAKIEFLTNYKTTQTINTLKPRKARLNRSNIKLIYLKKTVYNNCTKID